MKNYLEQHDNLQRSKPHQRIEKCLDEIGISYLSEQHFSPYTVDILIPEWHLAIEADGPFHSQSKDRNRDKYIKEMYGLEILRINMKGWRTKNSIIHKVKQFIEEHADSTEDRKQVWTNWQARH